MSQFALFDSPLDLALDFWTKLLSPQDHVIDATCGNGYDSLKVLSLIPEGYLYCLDIQKQACQNTHERLKNSFTNFEIFCQSHESFPEKIKKSSIKLIIYNLGYLPKGNKNLTTMKDSTLKSLKNAINLLAPTGVLSVMCYVGHDEGSEEEKEVIKWASELHKTEYLVTYHKLLNRQQAPALCLIQKQKEIKNVGP